jgi:CMP-N,N'-diacetyllegionaminic acid synthase
VTVPTVVALVPARSGSERVPGKNVRPLCGHPLLAYAIETSLQSGVFERVVVSTDSEAIAEVARWYGADVPFLRPSEFATGTSPDIEWLGFTLERLPETYDLFAIVRATNPFRGPDAVGRGLAQLLATPEADSLRAVERVKQHPGKMWLLEEGSRTMRPLLDQSHLEVAWHAGQYQALPEVYVQNSALEIA